MKFNRHHGGISLVLVVIGTLILTACGSVGSDSDGLPDMLPTITALPPTTPTDIPEQAVSIDEIEPVNWDNVEQFYAAMRPAFADDIDAFADRHRYYIEATLTFEGPVAVIQGAQRVRYTNHTEDTLDTIVFRLYPNLAAIGGRMVVYDTWVNEEPVEPELAARETALIVPLANPIAPGESAEVQLHFSVAAEQGMNAGYGEFGYRNYLFSGPQWHPLLAPYDDNGWWMTRPTPQGDVSYAETGLFEIMLTVPEDFVIAISGSEIDEQPAGDGMVTHHIVSGPMRESTLVASPILGKLIDEVDGIAVNVYFWPGDEGAAEEVMDITRDSLAVNNRTYGEYPYAEFDVVETFHYSAMEYPGLIFVAERAWERGNAFMEGATVHEIGHQWFYSLVGNDQVDHPWIDESLTSFTEYVYWRDIHGDEDAADYITNDRDFYNFYRGTGAPDLVLNLPTADYINNSYGAIVYTKGPLFYYELQTLLGDDVFFQALRTYFERYRYEVAESVDILNVFEEVSGQELDEIFYQWVGEFEGLDPAVIEEFESRSQPAS